jgi:hypothetical protein
MRRLVAAAVFLALGCGAAHADNCSKSREYLLGSLAGELPMPAQSYDELFKTCVAASAMGNVRDAYILRDGGIAVVPKQDSISATAATLSQFCNSYPRGTLRFLTRRELAVTKSVLGIIRMSSDASTSCRKIKGLS